MATVRLQLRRGEADQWDAANPTLAAGEIGIETDTNTFKFGDGSTPWNSLSYALSQTVDDYILLSTKGVANGVASLDSSGFIPSAQLPPLAKVTVSSAANQAARLALTAEPGDIAIQSDNGTTYVLASSPASTNGNWREISATAAISAAIATHESDTTGVHGIADTAALATTTNVATAKSEAITAAGTDATAKANTAQDAAIAAAASALSTHELDTTNIHGIANTSLLATTANVATAKSEAIASSGTAADTKISTAVSALTKSSVGLSNVDNTSDALKPVSNATLVALDLKAPLNSPAITGDATAVNLTLSGNLTVNGTTSTINSTTLTVQDKDIVLGQTSSPTDAGADTGGIILKGTTDKSIKYSVAKSAWDFSENINLPADKTVKINNIDILTLTTVLGKSLPGVVVGTTETQTLTNKTITSPSGLVKADVGLGSVDNTSDAAKPISTDTQTALDLKAPLAAPTFTGTVTLPSTTSIGLVDSTELGYVNGVTSAIQTQIDSKAPIASPTFTGTVSGVTKAMVGLGSVDNTSDAAKPISTATQTALDLKADSSAITELAQDAVNTAIIAGNGLDKVYDDVANTITIDIDSTVATLSGTQTLTNKTLTSPSITTPTGIVKSDVGLSNVNNTSDLGKPISTATQTALDLKAPIASPTFTGTVSGVTKAMVGLTNADDTSDAAKPISTATQTALDLKAPLASPTFTGTVTLPTGTITTGMIADGAVATADIADVAVSTAKIADAAITTAKIADDSITSAKIVAGTIVNSDINATAAIDWTKLAISSTVDATELGYVNGVTSAIQTQIDTKLSSATAASTYAPLASPTFTGTVTLPTGTITTGMIADGAVATADIADVAVSTAKIADSAVTSAKIADLTIVDGDISASAAIAQSKISGLTSALDLKAPLSSPALTGVPTAPTATAGTNTTQVATTAFVGTAVSDLVASAPAALNTLNELATALGNDASFSTTITNSIGLKAPLASPTFTGTVTVAAAGVAFTDGTQTKAGVPSLTTIGTTIGAAYNLGTGGVSGPTHGLTLRDQLIPISGTFAVTVPTNATLAFPIGTSIDFYQSAGTGANFVEAVGVTILRTPGLKLRTTYSSATLTKVATDTWLLAGDLSA